MSNANLAHAKQAKNDEFYTQFNDIEAEMTAYYEYNHEVFRNKIILMPCDDPEWSNFVRFFATNFKRYGIKALISTSYANSGTNDKLTDAEKNSPIYDPAKHKTRGKLFVMTGDMNGDGKIDSDDVSFQKYLEGDGDFRSDEVTRLRDEADIIVTNPPFSLFREFVHWIMEGKKKFIIMGNINAITYKEIFPLIKDNKMWGGTCFNKTMEFRLVDDAPKWDHIEKVQTPAGIHSYKVGKVPAITWFTNLDHGIRHEKMILDTMANNLRFNKSLRKRLAKYGDPNHYPKYDNYDAIEIPVTKCIPSDYKGVMGVPITFLGQYNPEQFEIIGTDANNMVDELGIKPIGQKWVDAYKAHGGTGHITANMHSLVFTAANGSGITTYKRILIRHKEVK